MRLTSAVVTLLLGFCSTFAAAQPSLDDRFPSQLQVESLSGGLNIAPSNLSPRQLNATSLALIKDFEHWSSIPYDDEAGYCTIGFGHLLALKRCSTIPLGEIAHGISRERGINLLQADTLAARIAVEREVREPISDDQYGALVSFVFNVGERNLRDSQLLRYVEAGDFKEANRQFGLWIKARGEVQDGLIIRRRCEAALFRGELIIQGQNFDRSQCAPLNLNGSVDDPLDIYTGLTDKD